MNLEETISCQNCRLVFSDLEARACPRCNSTHLIRHVKKSEGAEKQTDAVGPHSVQHTGSTQRIFGDTKDAWKSFHSSEVSSCPQCGGTRFSLDFKHKEKVCSNCGAVLSLRRKQV